MQLKGQAGSAVFRSSALLPNFQVIQNWLLQIPLAPDCGRVCRAWHRTSGVEVLAPGIIVTIGDRPRYSW